VVNTRRVMEYAKEVGARHVIFLSAAGALGVSKTDRTRDEESFGKTDPDYIDYLNTQYIQDKITCQSIVDALPMPTTTLYLTTVYGPGLNDSVLKNFTQVCGRFPLIVCPPGGTSWLDLRDFLAALDFTVEQQPQGRFVITGGNITFPKLFKIVAQLYDVSWRKLVFPLPKFALVLLESGLVKAMAKGISPAIIKSGFGYKYYSCHKARQIFGWKPKFDLQDALRSILIEGKSRG
jgi:nucleoside-diphosphate-sugar epimerase